MRQQLVRYRNIRCYSSSAPIVSVNPATGKLLKSYDFMARKDIDQMLETSQKTFQEYKQSTYAERAIILEKVAENLLKNKNELGKVITTEMGKPIMAAVAEIEKCAQCCTYFAKEGEKMLNDEVEKTDAADTRVVYQPLGPILQGAPFNFPFWQVIRFAAPALMAGNTVIIRHSHSVPQCAELIEHVFTNGTGLPAGAFKNAFVDNPSVSRMIQDFRIRGVTFTGSTQTGRIFAEQAGRHLKKHVLELGGNDAFIVLKDADLDLAVKNAVSARILNNGQSCISSKRFIVEEPVVKEFTERILADFQKLKVGDPMDPTVNVGPLARKDLRDKIASQVSMSVSQGARLLYGGSVPKSDGFFYQPTVLGDVKPGMVAEEEELFGPVATIIPVANEKQAVEIANHSEYGLGGTVFTRDIEKGNRIARELESGLAFVNGFVKSFVNLPFGGVKNSGYGRECGRAGILEWTNIKTVAIYRPFEPDVVE